MSRNESSDSSRPIEQIEAIYRRHPILSIICGTATCMVVVVVVNLAFEGVAGATDGVAQAGVLVFFGFSVFTVVYRQLAREKRKD